LQTFALHAFLAFSHIRYFPICLRRQHMAPFYTEYPFPKEMFEKFIRENNGETPNPTLNHNLEVADAPLRQLLNYDALRMPVREEGATKYNKKR
jgi:hypothetical protein